MTVRSKLLLASVAMTALAAPVAANAQSANPTGQADTTAAGGTGDIVVTGIRGSLESALNFKRQSSVIVDAVSAEDVGKFPDTNVAESLQHVPGVSVDHEFGDGEKVSILGTDPSLNRTLLNGQTIASVGWYTQDTPSRSFNYTLLAPEVVSRAEVYRSSVASIEEGSIGGTVIVRTRKPLDLKSGLMQGSVGIAYNDLSNRSAPTATALYSWHNKSKTFGIVIAGQHFTQFLRRDGIETAGVTTGDAYLTSANSKGTDKKTFQHVIDAVGDNADAVGPSSLSSALFTQKRQRDGGNIGLQFKPNDRLEIEFDGLYTRERYNNVNQSMYGYNTSQPGAVTSLTAEDGILVRGTFADTAPADCGTRASKCVGLSYLPLYVRQSTVKTYAMDLRGSYDFGGGWTLSLEGGRTRATGGTQHQFSGTFRSSGGYTYDLSPAPDKAPTFTFADPTEANDTSRWYLSAISDVKLPYTDRENYAQADIVKKFDGPITAFRVGGKYKAHESTQKMLRKSLTIAESAGIYADAIGATFTPGDFLHGFSGVTSDQSDHFLINTGGLSDYISGTDLGDYQDVQASDFDIHENITNAYVQADYDWHGFRGNVGVRYAHTRQISDGFEVSSSGDEITPVSYRRSYNNLLPSMSVSYDVSRTVVARFSAAQVISRAGYGDLSSYFRLSDTNLTGVGGNPNLDPYKSNNFDASVEWYFAHGSYLSGSLFYRDIRNYILDVALPEDHFNATLGEVTTYSVSRPQNAGKASSKGFAVAYQQVLPLGFGLTAAYTYVDGHAEDGSQLPFASKHQVSVSPYFERGGLSVRTSLTWRSKYFTGVDTNSSLYTRAFTELGATVNYQVDRHLQFSVSGSNLLNSTYYKYADEVKLVRGMYKNGRRFMLTARFKY